MSPRRRRPNDRKPIGWFFKRLMDKMPWLPLRLSIYYFFRFTGPPPKHIKHRFPGTIRWASMQDLIDIDNCARSNHFALYLARMLRHDKCVIATTQSGIPAAYGWISNNTFHIENRTRSRIDIEPGMIYVYDCYIRPEYRLTGLWVGLMDFIMDSNLYDPEKGLFGFIAYGNTASFRVHVRFGFELYLRRIILAISTRVFSFDRPVEHNPQNVRRLIGIG